MSRLLDVITDILGCVAIAFLIFHFLFWDAKASEKEVFALRIDSCLKSSACDRFNKNKHDWHTDIIPVPEGEKCSPGSAVSEGIKWLETNRPDSHWAGSVCIKIVGQDL